MADGVADVEQERDRALERVKALEAEGRAAKEKLAELECELRGSMGFFCRRGIPALNPPTQPVLSNVPASAAAATDSLQTAESQLNELKEKHAAVMQVGVETPEDPSFCIFKARDPHFC